MPKWKVVGTGVLLIISACRTEPAGVPPEVAQARFEAARDACISAEILSLAQENLSTLAQMHGLDDPGADPQDLPPGPASAAYQYARIYDHHAELRHAAYAHADSALNRSRTPADSARHTRILAGLAVSPPVPGSIEANVAAAYSQVHAAIQNDEDHPCNWDV